MALALAAPRAVTGTHFLSYTISSKAFHEIFYVRRSRHLK
jgi:hypothetical protein